ncbi:MAG: hypothetical protein H8D22_12695 [Candidatus Cloacimonetes bacterium]|nr:hypothetical protein [Candidatus Cloacimonadota bacterium]
MGLSPSTKAQILYDDSLQIFLPDQKKLYLFEPNSELNINLDFDRIIRKVSIIEKEKKKFIIPVSSEAKLFFDQKFNLELIQKEDIKINLKDYRNRLPYNLIIFHDEKEVASLWIDGWNFSELKDEIFNLKIPNNIEITTYKKNGIK